jgi:hypothetical protein
LRIQNKFHDLFFSYPGRILMTPEKRSLLCISSFYLFTFMGIVTVFLFNPFYNECILGDCNNDSAIYVYNSGMQYEGEWKDGKKDGEGILTYPDGTKYVGEWKNDRMHGHGVKTYKDLNISRYSGEWKNGKKDGWGTQVYKTGNTYTGNWKNGKMHGQGRLITQDGRILKGKWNKGNINGRGILIYPDGRKYTGTWRNNVITGSGVFTYPDGTQVNIKWGKDKVAGSSEFYPVDFEVNYNLEELCTAIKSDINVPLKARENTVEWLNELLEVPNLYAKLREAKREADFSLEINNLIKATQIWRNKDFSELHSEGQDAIKRLNRLLIEHFYPEKTPKIKWSNPLYVG